MVKIDGDDVGRDVGGRDDDRDICSEIGGGNCLYVGDADDADDADINGHGSKYGDYV